MEKKMRYSTWAFVSAFGAMLAVGCSASGVSIPDGNGGGTTGTAQSALSFCDGYCSRVNTCDGSKDEQTCADACSNSNAAVFPKLRGDVVKIMQQCIDDKDCKTILTTNVVNTCANEAAAAVAPTQLAVDFCDSLSNSATKCGGKPDKAACLTRAKLYNDGALGKAKDCTAKACSDVDACVDAALGSLKAMPDGNNSSSNNSGSGSGGSDAGTKDSGGGSTTDSGTNTTTCSAIPSKVTFDNGGTCDSCMSDYCCYETSACWGDYYCSGLVSCLTNCNGSSTCQQQCQQTYSQGVSKYQAWAQCAQGSCTSSCQ